MSSTRSNKRRQDGLPADWNPSRARDVVRHYDAQTEDDSIAEMRAAFERSSGVLMRIPQKLAPLVKKLVDKHIRERVDRRAKSTKPKRRRAA